VDGEETFCSVRSIILFLTLSTHAREGCRGQFVILSFCSSSHVLEDG